MEQDALNPVAGGGYESWAEKGHGCVCGKQQGWGGGILQSSSVKRASCGLTELCWVPEGTVSCVCSAIFPGCAESLLQAQGHGECRAVWGRCRSSSHTFRVRTPWGSPEAGSLGPSLSLLRPTLPPHPDRPVSLDHACTAWAKGKGFSRLGHLSHASRGSCVLAGHITPGCQGACFGPRALPAHGLRTHRASSLRFHFGIGKH